MRAAQVEMHLSASLQKWKKAPVASYALAGKKTVREFLLENGIPKDEVAIILINGKRQQFETLLKDGDSLSLFPLMGGG
jgi:molybdopterin converting factor small subunit